jgi:hypothetical protein
MKSALALAAAALMAIPAATAPELAAAQAYRSYGPEPCGVAKHRAARTGTVAGGVVGALVGSAVAGGGTGSRIGGALIGGTVGAVAGHEIGRSSVRCVAYPRRVGYHRGNCRWVVEHYRGRDHGFEICRDRDGVWRPSGRA